MPDHLPWTGDEDADKLLAADPLALLIGMLLDQQITMEKAFLGPKLIRDRLDGELDSVRIAAMDPEDFVEIFRQKPAIHRFPGSMAKRTQALCAAVAEEYNGDASGIWAGVDEGAELLSRLRALPGFGEEKSRIFVAVLGKRMGVKPAGWEDVAANWASIADVASPEDIVTVREAKRLRKQGG